MASEVAIGGAVPPTSFAQFRTQIEQRYDELSDRLRRVARHVLDQPNDFAFETLAVIASRSNVQPSTIVRFAQSFGFDGGSQMQRLVRDDLLRDGQSLGYAERARQHRHSMSGKLAGPAQLLAEFVEGNGLALESLRETTTAADLERAIALITQADTVFVVGFRRSFPVSTFLAYLLAQANKRTVLVDAIGGLQAQQTARLTEDDLLIAISFAPYSPETSEITATAAKSKCPIIAITDSSLSAIAKQATLVLRSQDAEIRSFRSLSTTMCLVQTLAIGFVVEQNADHAAVGRRAANGGSE